MIVQFHVENYKALRDVTLDLTPLHLLIGPNDSGKTSVLEALAALCRSVDFPLSEAFIGLWEGRSLVWREDPELPIRMSAQVRNGVAFGYDLQVQPVPGKRAAFVHAEELQVRPQIVSGLDSRGLETSYIYLVHYGSVSSHWDEARRVRDALSGVQLYRWVPRLMALPAAPDSARRFKMDSTGFGLALLLDDILGYDRNLFTRLEDRFRNIFPQVKSIKLISRPAYRAPIDSPEQIPTLTSGEGKGIYFEFESVEQPVAATQVSDGMLLILGYLAVLHSPEPPRVLLVEEPENGIHPKRLDDVLKILRELASEQSHTQILMTTHSPYVVDHFKPEEVTLCSKRPDGSVQVRRLSDSPEVRQQLDVFTLGEIWTGEGDEAIAAAKDAAQ